MTNVEFGYTQPTQQDIRIKIGALVCQQAKEQRNLGLMSERQKNAAIAYIVKPFVVSKKQQ